MGPARLLAEIEALGFGAELVDPEQVAVEAAGPGDSGERSPLVDELLAMAKHEGKPLVLEFSGKWCAACRELEEKTLADPRVREALDGVIFLKILVDEDRAAATQFGVRSIPQLRFVDPDGTVRAEDQGVIPVERMLAHLGALKEKTSR